MYIVGLALKLLKVLYVYLKQNNCLCLYKMLNTIELFSIASKICCGFTGAENSIVTYDLGSCLSSVNAARKEQKMFSKDWVVLPP